MIRTTIGNGETLAGVPVTMAQFSETIVVEAAQAEVWRLLADIGSIGVWNPGVISSYQLGEEPVTLGSRRYCDLGGRDYLAESVAEFEPERRITMRIDQTNLPFSEAVIRFTLEPLAERTRVTVAPDYSLKFGPIGMLIDLVLVRRAYRNGMRALLRGLKRHVESATQTDSAEVH